MLKEKVGRVTEEEKNQVMKLHERKLALEELLAAIPDFSMTKEARDELHENTITETGRTVRKLQAWWEIMQQRYNWKSAEGGHWNIDFQTNEIMLIAKEETLITAR